MTGILGHFQARCVAPPSYDVPVGTVILAGFSKMAVVAFVNRGDTHAELKWETAEDFYTDDQLNDEIRHYNFVAVILPEEVQVVKGS